MDSTVEAILQSWPLSPWLLLSLALVAAVYLRGWRSLHRAAPHRFKPRQPAKFLAGLLTIYVALASPIESFASLLLQMHMIQHLLLMVVAPPLLWLGEPLLPMLRGLPATFREVWIAPLFRVPWLRAGWRNLTHPAAAWVLFIGATWIWHVPALYELGLRSETWHQIEHACFLGSALLFWFPVVRPYPSPVHFSLWLLPPYLLLADIQNTLLSALLTFSDRVLYPHYLSQPRLWGVTALDDQSTAGVIMWVPGSLAFLLPLAWITCRLLFGDALTMDTRVTVTRRSGDTAKTHGNNALAAKADQPTANRRVPLPLAAKSESHDVDVLRFPILGRFLRWRHARPVMQAVLALFAAAIIVDGLSGPQAAPMNLAGVVPWIHWRGFVVLGLLVGGNFFCMACPFMLPRTIARKWLPAGRAWPRWLRTKWLAIALLIVFFWAYETFALWASPWWTAWIAVAYFLGALVIDGWFRDAAFCKYVCPIGQFHFVHSLLSPLVIRVRDATRCTTCQTKDCIRGGNGIPGCDLHLFLPLKLGNMDCTMCLDCVHACPYDNVAIGVTTPGLELLDDHYRSGVGRWSRRWDIAVLVALLVSGAFVNAAAMTAPVVAWQEAAAARLGMNNANAVAALCLLVALSVPVLLVALAAVSSRSARSLLPFVYAFLPLGFGMWLAHYSFHLFTSWGTIVPTTQRFIADIGLAWLGAPEWSLCCCGPAPDWLVKLEMAFLDAGLLGSLFLAYQLAQQRLSRAAPWAMLMILLFAVGIWIIFQPMDMRGTMAG